MDSITSQQGMLQVLLDPPSPYVHFLCLGREREGLAARLGLRACRCLASACSESIAGKHYSLLAHHCCLRIVAINSSSSILLLHHVAITQLISSLFIVITWF